MANIHLSAADLGLTPKTPAPAPAPQPVQPVSQPAPQPTSTGMDDPNVLALRNAIRKKESGGNYKAIGSSGEAGAYQFTQPTWKSLAKTYLNDENAKLTPENQDTVVYKHIYDLKNQGYTPDQIAGIWNHGNADYGNAVGVNSYEVKYDAPGYVRDVMANYQQEVQNMKSAKTLGLPPGSVGTTPQTAGTTLPDGQAEGGKDFYRQGGQKAQTLEDIGKGILKGAGSTLLNIGGAGSRALEAGYNATIGQMTGQKAFAGGQAAEEAKVAIAPKGTAQKVGYTGEQIGEFFLPIPGLDEAKGEELASKAISNPLVAKMVGRAGVGATEMGVKTAAQGGTPGQVVTSALLGGAIPAAGALAEPLLKPLGKAIGESAIKQYTRLLKPTTNENKAIAEKIVPELLGRDTMALTKKGLLEKFASKSEEAGEAIGSAWEKIPDTETVKSKDLLDQLEKAKDQLMVTSQSGEKIAVDAAKVKNIEDMQGTIAQLGEDIPVGSLRKFRQILDKSVAQGKGFFGKTLEEGSKLEVKREAAGAMRKILADKYPDLNALNKEYTFWQNAEKVLGDTMERTKGHETPLTDKLLAAGGALELATHAAATPEIGAVLGLSKLIKSTAWNTFSAVTKNRLADYLAEGNLAAASSMVNRLTGSLMKKGK